MRAGLFSAFQLQQRPGAMKVCFDIRRQRLARILLQPLPLLRQVKMFEPLLRRQMFVGAHWRRMKLTVIRSKSAHVRGLLLQPCSQLLLRVGVENFFLHKPCQQGCSDLVFTVEHEM